LDRSLRPSWEVNFDWMKLNSFRWNLDNVIVLQAALMIIMEFILFYYGVGYWQKGLIVSVLLCLCRATFFFFAKNQFWGMGRVIRDVYEGFADSKRMVEILKLEHEIRDVPNAKELSVQRGILILKM
jgi:hypothetical protein